MMQTIIERALSAPLPLLEYKLSAEIARLLSTPDAVEAGDPPAPRGVVETGEMAFDLEDFRSHGQCTATLATDIHPLRSMVWTGSQSRLDTSLALHDVSWGQERLQVLTVVWRDRGDQKERSWVIGRDQAVAQAFFEAVCGFSTRLHEEVYVFDDGRWSKSHELYTTIQAASLDSLVLAPGLQEELVRDARSFFAAEERYREHGIPWKRGLLLTGPPGNGKTHLIKGLLRELCQQCLYVRSFGSQCATDQSSIKRIFSRARRTRPCVLVFEDLDSLINDQNRAFFLNELDGFAENHGILVMATTNHPDRLDPAIVDRPSRFDRKYLFDLPALAERRTYLHRWRDRQAPALRPSPAAIDAAAEQTAGFSFAYLKELTLAAIMRWAEQMEPDGMDAILASATALLRQQVRSPDPGAAPALAGQKG